MADILALIDGSIYSRSVCGYTAWFAGRIEGSVELIHVLGNRQTGGTAQDLSGNIGLGARSRLLAELAELDRQKAKLAQKYGHAVLDEAANLVKAGNPVKTGKTFGVTTNLRRGDLLETLAESEAGARLVVIGKRGESADFAKGHLGSNLERIVRTSTKPVLVASRAFQPVRRILLAFDGGMSSLKAVELMSRSPAFKDLDVLILSVGSDTQARRHDTDGAAASLRENGCRVETKIVEGQPDTVIIGQAESGGHDLLAMGAYGHSRIRNLIIGSTTTVMIRSCKLPVLLFR